MSHVTWLLGIFKVRKVCLTRDCRLNLFSTDVITVNSSIDAASIDREVGIIMTSPRYKQCIRSDGLVSATSLV